MFRIWKFHQDKVRPIIVKLHNQWDKRLILSKRSSLKTSIKVFFIVPDEPLNVRRKICFDRLKQKAIKEGKHVNVANDVLFIDGAEVYSLKNGSRSGASSCPAS